MHFAYGFAIVVALAARAYTYDYCRAALPVLHTPPPNLTLVQVAVLTRHGDRTPTNLVGLDRERDVEYACAVPEYHTWGHDGSALTFQQRGFRARPTSRMIWGGNCTVGQLTTRGAQQHLELGARLRELYVAGTRTLGEQLAPDDLYVRSSEYWRTKQSAMAHLAGLYPPGTRPAGAVVPIRVAEYQTETLFPNVDNCPALATAFGAARATPEWRRRQGDMEPVRRRLEEALGTAGRWPGGFDQYSDILHCRRCSGQPVPVGDDDAERVFAQAEWENSALASADGVAKLAGGFLAAEMAEFLSARGASGSPKYGLFSAHDTSVTALMAVLGHDERWPPYASNVVLELWSAGDGRDYVRVQYNGELRHPVGCRDALCTWDEFAAIVQKHSVSDYASECFGITKP
eukprot:m51a1_g4191 hypothetical protein (403) ;mRNA; r:401671-403001